MKAPSFTRALTVAHFLAVAACAYFAATDDSTGWKLYFVLMGAINAQGAVRSARRWSQR